MMRTTDEARQPFDEQAALAELERLRDAIAETRRVRSERSDAFEAFVQSFRAPQPERGPSMSSPHAAPVPPPVANAAPETASPAFDAAASPPSAAPARSPSRRRRSLAPRVIGGAAIAAACVLLVARPWRGARPETPVAPSSTSSQPAPPTATSAPTDVTANATPAPAPAPVRQHALEGELTVQRRVWVRVIVDGERTVERELPAGTQIPLRADRGIVVRAGDAGALRLMLNGEDRGPLGLDGEIVTRTFPAGR